MTTYTHGHSPAVLRSHGWRDASNSAAYLLPLLTSGASVLDVGCGPGTITADLAARVAPGSVLGVDAATVAIETAAASFADVPNLEFAVGNIFDLGMPEAWDVVHAHQVLQHLADPVGAIRELLRVCAPGGVVAVRDADYAAMSWFPHDERLQRWQGIYRQVARANGGEPDAGRHLLAWAHAAGARDITPSASVWCFATPADRSWWGDTWATRISTGPLADRAVELGLAGVEELADCAAGWRAWSEHPDAWFTVVHAELLIRG
jgi:2-polyprenyl-3-methyl-5-hydroxy-6-metoxy-1,4-benzoquinol methylase